MSPKRFSLVPIDPSSAPDFFYKATEFFEIMNSSIINKKWNGVGLNAVHCAISTSDALLADAIGKRNTSQDHRVAADVLSDYIADENIKNYSNHLRKILGLKNTIEYERRLFTQKDAEEIVKHTERFYFWARKKLNY